MGFIYTVIVMEFKEYWIYHAKDSKINSPTRLPYLGRSQVIDESVLNRNSEEDVKFFGFAIQIPTEED